MADWESRPARPDDGCSEICGRGVGSRAQAVETRGSGDGDGEGASGVGYRQPGAVDAVGDFEGSLADPLEDDVTVAHFDGGERAFLNGLRGRVGGGAAAVAGG